MTSSTANTDNQALPSTSHSRRVQHMLQQSLRLAATTLMITIGASSLSGCIPTAIGVATVTAVDLVKERRTAGTMLDDNLVEVSILKDIFTHKQLGGTHINPTALNGVVLLTGEVANKRQKAIAEQIANSYQSVSQVVNQLDLVGNSSLTSRANDSIITGKVKAALIRDKRVDATNVKVVTERGTVYLMGIVSPVEAETAVKIAQSTAGVTRIIKIFMDPQ